MRTHTELPTGKILVLSVTGIRLRYKRNTRTTAVSSTLGRTQMTTPTPEPDLTSLDDEQLISQRADPRTRLGRLPAHARLRASLARQYEVLTHEFDRRALAACQQLTSRRGSAPGEQRANPSGQQS